VRVRNLRGPWVTGPGEVNFASEHWTMFCQIRVLLPDQGGLGELRDKVTEGCVETGLDEENASVQVDEASVDAEMRVVGQRQHSL
jgi:hypothetical protein